MDCLKSFRGVEAGGEGIGGPGPVPKGDMVAVLAEGFREDDAGFAGGKIGQHAGPVQGYRRRSGNEEDFHTRGE